MSRTPVRRVGQGSASLQALVPWCSSCHGLMGGRVRYTGEANYFKYYNGLRVIAKLATSYTLIVVGEWDGLMQVSQAVFDRLTNTASKRLVHIEQGTHLVFLEKNRLHLFREVQLFLDEPRSAN